METFITKGLFENRLAGEMVLGDLAWCLGTAVLLGIFLAWVYGYKTAHTQSFMVTLASLPAVVCMIILMVNGNLGTGVAVAGAFSLVRFRSVPGSAKEIGAIFLAMGVGLATGMGYLGCAVFFALLLGGVVLLLTVIGFGRDKKREKQKLLRITIPENLDYTGIFDDLFAEYMIQWQLVSVKTTNMGSLFKLSYEVELKNAIHEKEFLDKLRCRNGNLEISILRKESGIAEL